MIRTKEESMQIMNKQFAITDYEKKLLSYFYDVAFNEED